MTDLGGLLGAYGSDDESEHDDQGPEDTQKTGQVTLLDDEESGGHVDLSHLTSGGAARGEADAAQRQQQGPQGPRPPSGASERGQGEPGGAPEGMDVDEGQPAGAAGGEEQPPAAAEEQDPLAALPPEMRQPPEGECYPDIQARVTNWLHLARQRGKTINEEIRKSRGYRNPEFFAKMVEHLEIDQYGTSFAPEVFDPKALPPEDYLDALQREWAAEEERRKAARASGQGRVDFHKSASNPQLVQPALKPGLQPGLGQPITAAQIAARAAAAQGHMRVGGVQQAAPAAPNPGAAAALAAAQAKAAQLAARLAAQQR